MILLALIAASFALSAFSEAVRRVGNAAWPFFAAVAVAALSVVNLVRDYSIGTDVGVYGNYIFTSAVLCDSLGSFLKVCDGLGGVEYGYGLLNYAVASFTDSPHVFYFVLGVLTNGAAYLAIFRLRDVAGVSMGWLTYMLMFFPTTLNVMRQSLAVVLVMLAVTYASDARPRPSAFLLVVAYLFHRSAVIGIPMALVAYLWSHQLASLGESGMRARRRRLLVVVLAAVLALPGAVELLDSAGLIGEKYSNYLGGATGKDLLNPVLVRLPFVILAVALLKKDFSGAQARSNLILLLMTAEVLLLPLQLISDAAFRISLYFGIFKVVAYPVAVSRLGGGLALGGHGVASRLPRLRVLVADRAQRLGGDLALRRGQRVQAVGLWLPSAIRRSTPKLAATGGED